MAKKNKKVLFVCSAGGHLAEILQLEAIRNKYEYLIVTEDVETTRSLNKMYNMKYIKPDVKGRGLIFYYYIILNFLFSVSILLKFKPSVIITTGSHTAFPMCLLGKLLRINVVYILSYARVSSKAKSANIIYPISDLFLVQWESAQKLYTKSIYKGSLF